MKPYLSTYFRNLYSREHSHILVKVFLMQNFQEVQLLTLSLDCFDFVNMCQFSRYKFTSDTNFKKFVFFNLCFETLTFKLARIKKV